MQHAGRIGFAQLCVRRVLDDIRHRVLLEEPLRQVGDSYAVAHKVEEYRHGRCVQSGAKFKQAHAHDHAENGRRSQHEHSTMCALDAPALSVVRRIGNTQDPRRHARIVLNHLTDLFEVRAFRVMSQLDRLKQRHAAVLRAALRLDAQSLTAAAQKEQTENG